MAPSATETVTGTERANPTFKVEAGDYKEIFAAKFKEEDERKGTSEHAPATVCTHPRHRLRLPAHARTQTFVFDFN